MGNPLWEVVIFIYKYSISMVITQVDRKGQNIQVIWIAIDIELGIVIKLGEKLALGSVDAVKNAYQVLSDGGEWKVTEMTKVKFYENVEDELLKFAVIISKTQNKYVFCKQSPSVYIPLRCLII